MFEQERYQDTCVNGAAVQNAKANGLCGGSSMTNSPRRTTPREEAEKQIAYMQEELNKKHQAALFFAANPAFDEFLVLIRSGAINI